MILNLFLNILNNTNSWSEKREELKKDINIDLIYHQSNDCSNDDVVTNACACSSCGNHIGQ
jgi:hypothetical protein